MDAFTEEVLSLAKASQAKHPLIKRLSSGCNSGREIATKFPMTIQPSAVFETTAPCATTTNESWHPFTTFPPTPVSETGYSQHPHSSSSANSLPAFSNGYETTYQTNIAPRIPSALDLSMMRECEAYMRPLQSSEWFNYSQYAPDDAHQQQIQQYQLQQQQHCELYSGYSCDNTTAFTGVPSAYAPTSESEGCVFYDEPSFYDVNEMGQMQYGTPLKMGQVSTNHVTVCDQPLDSNSQARLPVIM